MSLGRENSRKVAALALRRLREMPYRVRQSYLDVGCGNGAAGLRISSECGLEVTGIDVDPEQVRLAQRAARGLSGAPFMVGDATRLPFRDDEFDLVAANKTTHHVPDWESARPGPTNSHARVAHRPCVARMTCVNVSERGNELPDGIVRSLNATTGALANPG